MVQYNHKKKRGNKKMYILTAKQVKLINALLENNGEEMTNRQLSSRTSYSTTEIKKQLLELRVPIINFRKDNKYHWSLSEMATSQKIIFVDSIEKMEKEKNILHFYFPDNIVIDYDFIKLSFINIYDYMIIGNDMIKLTFESFIFQYMAESPAHNIPEWIFSYPDLFLKSWNACDNGSHRWIANLPKTIKKGYIQYCTENNQFISNSSYELFIWSIVLNNDKKLLAFVNRVMPNLFKLNMNDIEENMSFYQILINKLYKIYMYSASWSEMINIRDLAIIMDNIIICHQLIEALDTNRGVSYNYHTIEQKVKSERNKILAQHLKQLNFINDMENDDYIIKVPQSIDDLINEGKQQHNCVGYFYNDNIIANKDLIYFIRMKNNPKKSFVTCRYNVSRRETVEHRYVNNHYESELENIRYFIDSIINDNLQI